MTMTRDSTNAPRPTATARRHAPRSYGRGGRPRIGPRPCGRCSPSGATTSLGADVWAIIAGATGLRSPAVHRQDPPTRPTRRGATPGQEDQPEHAPALWAVRLEQFEHP